MKAPAPRWSPVQALLLLACSCSPSGVPCTTASDCPYQEPLCQAGSCVACTSGAALCGAQHCSRSGEDAGRCVECTEDEHCGDSACWYGLCVGRCRDNADCPEGTCVLDDSGELGRCAPLDQVVVAVQPTGLAPALAAMAERTALRQALRQQGAGALPPPARVLRLLPSAQPYEVPPLVSLSPLFLIGDDARPTLGGDPTRDAIMVGAGMRVSLQRVSVRTAQRGVVCEDFSEDDDRRARLSLQQVSIRTTRAGALVVQGCELAMDRVALSEGAGGALRIEGSGRHRITNSFMSDTSHREGPIVQLRDRGGLFAFNTVINNGAAAGPVLTCDQGDQVVRGTLLVRSASELAIGGVCVALDGVVTDRPPPEGVRQGNPAFVDARPFGDYRLLDSPETRVCCKDQLALQPTDPRHDHFGSPRPNNRLDVGAHEIGEAP